MNRSKHALYNVIATVGQKIVIIICGFILPRLILTAFGSAVNGTVSSIASFLGVITLMECGFDSVAKTAFFRPLADHDHDILSKTYVAANTFFKKVAYIFVGYTLIIAVVFPFLTDNDRGFLFNATLVIIMAIGSFAQEYVGITYEVLFNADQRSFVASTLQICTVIINTIVCVILINSGATIHIVKMVSAVLFVVRPLMLYFFGHRKYKINYQTQKDPNILSNKWDNFGQSIATFVNSKTDYVLITIILSMKDASVYAIYTLVTGSLQGLLSALSTGFASGLGNMYANGEKEAFKKNFSLYEFVNTFCTFLLYSVAGVLLISFVRNYTAGVHDANYIQPIFGYILVAGAAINVLRNPYWYIAVNANKFKEISKSAYVEALINLVVSLFLVFPFGITGLAIGTLVAAVYRTSWLIYYSTKHISGSKISSVIKRYAINLIAAAALILVSNIIRFNPVSLTQWVVYATIITVIATVIFAIFNAVFYKEDAKELLTHIRKAIK